MNSCGMLNTCLGFMATTPHSWTLRLVLVPEHRPAPDRSRGRIARSRCCVGVAGQSRGSSVQTARRLVARSSGSSWPRTRLPVSADLWRSAPSQPCGSLWPGDVTLHTGGRASASVRTAATKGTVSGAPRGRLSSGRASPGQALEQSPPTRRTACPPRAWPSPPCLSTSRWRWSTTLSAAPAPFRRQNTALCHRSAIWHSALDG